MASRFQDRGGFGKRGILRKLWNCFLKIVRAQNKVRFALRPAVSKIEELLENEEFGENCGFKKKKL